MNVLILLCLGGLVGGLALGSLVVVGMILISRPTTWSQVRAMVIFSVAGIGGGYGYFWVQDLAQKYVAYYMDAPNTLWWIGGILSAAAVLVLADGAMRRDCIARRRFASA